MEFTDGSEKNVSQKPAVEVLKQLGYQLIDHIQVELLRDNQYNVLLKPILRNKLCEMNRYTYRGKKYAFSERNIDQALRDLDEALTDGLVKTNEKIYETLLYGRSYTEDLEDGSKRSFTLQFIDWEHLKNNDFYIIEEFAVECNDGRNTARPDIVLFINGIPFGVIECKKSSISVDQGIEQMLRNQSKEYIPHLFKYIQMVVATNKNEVKYATCSTPKKFWSVWKEQDEDWLEAELKKKIIDRMPTVQDKNIISLFHPSRVLEFMKYFILFDKDVKKICRYQQYFAIKEIIKTIEERDAQGNRQSGVIWHTQGSGKSLTMVMLTRYLLSKFRSLNPRIIVVTDRIELDRQINRTFNHSKVKAIKASTGNHLIKLIKDEEADVITTLVHKFDTAANKETKLESKDIFVLVDESHRSQYKELSHKMRNVFPNACYLGFTGTPLMKKQRSTVERFGGKLIHAYTIADGVEDKAIVPLLYEGKMVEQSVNKRAIDTQLEMITRNLSDAHKEEVMKKWTNFQRVASSDQRIRLIAFDINEHFCNNYKSEDSPFTAMLATNSKVEAIKYLRAFEELGDLRVGVVISSPDMREGHEAVDQLPDDKVVTFWNEMMAKYDNATDYEETLKDEFIHGEIDVLIVVDKLLTGFDAPRAAILYIDKEMKEHTLLQAIARVNRLYEGKDYGYIVDYRGLLSKLDEAMNLYSGAGLENFESGDLKGAVYDVTEIIGSLRQYYTELLDFFTSIQNKHDMEAFEVYLADEARRQDFYDILSHFSRNMAVALESEKVYDTLGKQEIEKYKTALKFYQILRETVKKRYSDEIDHKAYEVRMQKLMDNYIAAEGMMHITNPVDILDEEAFDKELERMSSNRSKADTIRTRMGRSISEKWQENPAYYKKFSERIAKIIEDYKEKRISDAEYLNKMQELKKEYREQKDEAYYPQCIKEDMNAKAFYGVVNEVIKESETSYGTDDDDIGELALGINEIIEAYSKVDWHNNIDVHNKIAQEIDDMFYDYSRRTGVEFSYDEIDKIIDKVKIVALKRY